MVSSPNRRKEVTSRTSMNLISSQSVTSLHKVNKQLKGDRPGDDSARTGHSAGHSCSNIRLHPAHVFIPSWTASDTHTTSSWRHQMQNSTEHSSALLWRNPTAASLHLAPSPSAPSSSSPDQAPAPAKPDQLRPTQTPVRPSTSSTTYWNPHSRPFDPEGSRKMARNGIPATTGNKSRA